MRRAAVVKVQIARRELGLDEDTYRLVLERVTGKMSSTACSDAELGRVLDAFKAQGWKPKVVEGCGSSKPRAARRADHPAAKKARALWLSLWHLGEVRDPSEAALEGFAHRQLGGERLQWADQARVYKLIEALKAMADRAGWSQDLAGVAGAEHVRTLKVRLIRALAVKLGAPLLPDSTGQGWGAFDEAELDDMVQRLGREVRESIEDAG